nr:hypothetical protein [Tanacetum cinerariifolium]
MHNNIMTAGSRDRPPMLATRRYPYPYIPTTVVVQAVAVTYDSPAIPEHTIIKTTMNMSPANKAHFESEKKAIHLILTEIRDEYTRLLMLAKQLSKYGKLSKRYNKEVPTEDSSTDLSHWKSNTCIVEMDDSNVIPNSSDMCEDDIQNDQNDVECDDERVALANLIANLKLDVNEKKDSKSIKEIKHNTCSGIERTEFEKYKAFNDRTVDYDKLKRKLNETLGQLAQKDIEIKEGLKLKAYEISVVKEKHDELIKQSILTKSHYEGLVKQKTKVITDLKLKEEHDIDKMLSLENS